MALAAGPDPLEATLRCLLLLARVLGVAADGASLRRELSAGGGQCGEADLLRAARAMGLRARLVRCRWSRLARMPLPALALGKEGSPLLVARADAEGVLSHDGGPEGMVILPRARFEAMWSGRLVLVARPGRPAEEGRPVGLRWFVPALLRHRGVLWEALAASVVLQFFGLLTPLFTQLVIDKVLVHRGLTTLDVLAVGMLALIVFETLLGGLRTYALAHTGSRIDVELGARLFQHLLGLPLAYFQARRVGDSVSRLRELENIRQFLTGAPLSAILDALFTVVFLAAMACYSALLTTVVLVALPIYGALVAGFGPPLRLRLEERVRRGAESHAFLTECLGGVETVKALAAEPAMVRRWEEHLAAAVRAGLRAASLANVAAQGIGATSRLTALAILWIGARLVIAGQMTVGELVAFNMLAGRVSGPVLRLAQLWQECQRTGIALARLGDILASPREALPGAAPGPLPRLSGHIVFDGVWFRYRPDGPEILRDLSFTIKAGEVVAIVGRSGSGKSTLARLIQRLHVPDRGRVMIDGMDLAHVDPVWLRRRVGVVPQESMLWSGTVRENIALGDPGLPMERVLVAAQLAGAHEFILELPGGYEAMVGEHGSTLSGGQRQRIAIARALAADPSIVVFDESTSALDAESEGAIVRRFPEICRGRTVLIIAHRMSMARLAPRVVALDRGRIVVDGVPGEPLPRERKTEPPVPHPLRPGSER